MRGLPPLQLPPGWPNSPLLALRANIAAAQWDSAATFARAVFAEQFGNGRRLDDEDTIDRAASRCGLDGRKLIAAATTTRAKERLRAHTSWAVATGVIGVPSLVIGDRIFWGDDQLETAAMARNASADLGAQ